MGTGAITQYVDVAQLVLYVFWIFFAGLVYYLVRENKREGYPLETESRPRRRSPAGRMPDAQDLQAARTAARSTVPNLTPSPQTLTRRAGARLGRRAAGAHRRNPMLDGVGPGAWADRADVPDLDFEGHAKIVPLRAGHDSASRPRTPTRAACRWSAPTARSAARCVDLWVDQSESLFRYLEVEAAGGGAPRAAADQLRAHHARRSVDVRVASSASSSPTCRARAAPTRSPCSKKKRSWPTTAPALLYADAASRRSRCC